METTLPLKVTRAYEALYWYLGVIFLFIVLLFWLLRFFKRVLIELLGGTYSDFVNNNYFFFSAAVAMFLLFAGLKIYGWSKTSYVITQDQFIKNTQALWSTREKSTDLRSFGSVVFKQGPLGKMFNYGTIHLHNKVIELDDEGMPDVKNAKEVAALLEQLTSGVNIKGRQMDDANSEESQGM